MAYDTLIYKSSYYVIISTSSTNPLDYRTEIEDNLKVSLYKGRVLFDLLLSNGFSPNRFIEMDFDGDKLVSNSASVIDVKDGNLKTFLYKYYSGVPNYIDNSILSNSEKFILKNQLLIS